MKTHVIQAALLIGLFAYVTGAIDAKDATFRIKAGNSALPEGARIDVSVGGEGCDCAAGEASGRVDNRGYATVILRSSCASVDVAKCRAMARAEIVSGGVRTVYKGSARLTQITNGPYVSTVIVVP